MNPQPWRPIPRRHGTLAKSMHEEPWQKRAEIGTSTCSPGKNMVCFRIFLGQANSHRSGLSGHHGFLFCHRLINPPKPGNLLKISLLTTPLKQIHIDDGGGPRATSPVSAQPCCPRPGALGLASRSSTPAGPCPPRHQRAGTRGD